MKFTKRLKYYLIGFGLGLFLVFFLFKDRSWSWLPENRVLDFISSHPILVNKDFYDDLKDKSALEKKIFDLVLSGNVDFSESQTKGEIKTYRIFTDSTQIEIALSFNDSISRVIQIEDSSLSYTKNLTNNGVELHMDKINFLNLIHDIEFSFNNKILCQFKSLGLKKEMIKKNLQSLNVLWEHSKPYRKPNPIFTFTITIESKEYIIVLERGDKRIRFNACISSNTVNLKSNLNLQDILHNSNCIEQ